MKPLRIVVLVLLPVAGLLLSEAVSAQTANGSPTAPASPGLVGTPRPVSRTAPSTRERGVRPDLAASVAVPPPHKPTAAERAEQKKLEHDLRICIGC